MRFRCERDVLVEALSTVGRAVSARGGSPVLSGVRLVLEGDQLVLTGSDLDLTISATVTVGGSEDGRAVVPAKLAADIGTATNGEIGEAFGSMYPPPAGDTSVRRRWAAEREFAEPCSWAVFSYSGA